MTIWLQQQHSIEAHQQPGSLQGVWHMVIWKVSLSLRWAPYAAPYLPLPTSSLLSGSLEKQKRHMIIGWMGRWIDWYSGWVDR
mmetsp:Transcript_11204/g.26399  ORF Transcript_11204/g.26399 Transcript_11204/m.26399 type:complete len:83 (-) Transcript_11204:187-435(-)